MKWNSIGKRLSYLLFYGMILAIGALPFPLLYAFSDFIAFLLRHIVKYRKKVIMTNLRRSFPEKSEDEIKGITSRFYGFLADYFVETCKLSVMKEKTIRKRMVFLNSDSMLQDLKEGRNVSLLLGHFGNWEWVSSLPLHLPTAFYGAQIYHPLENEAADKVFLKIRTRFGAICVKMNSIYRTVLKWKNEGIASAVGYIADQSPMETDTHLWVDFLNQDTPVFTGPERISTKLKAKVYYLSIKRVKRGYYEAEFIPLSDDASKEETFSLTRHYYKLLQQDIQRQPEIWLWSHRRWKRTREDFNRRWGSEASKRLERI